MARKRVTEKKQPQSMSVRKSDLERWKKAMDRLEIETLSEFMEIAANELSRGVASSPEDEITDQIAAQSKKIDSLQTEMSAMRRALKELTKVLSQLEPV